jgi:hypothetical protein
VIGEPGASGFVGVCNAVRPELNPVIELSFIVS